MEAGKQVDDRGHGGGGNGNRERRPDFRYMWKVVPIRLPEGTDVRGKTERKQND